MTSLLSWIATSTKKRASIRPAPAFAVPSAAGRPARMIAGLVPAAMNGTPSTQEECAPPASTSGRRLSAFLVAGGRRIPIGMQSDKIRRNGPKAQLLLNSPVDCHEDTELLQ
jgi:hypothetical protein